MELAFSFFIFLVASLYHSLSIPVVQAFSGEKTETDIKPWTQIWRVHGQFPCYLLQHIGLLQPAAPPWQAALVILTNQD